MSIFSKLKKKLTRGLRKITPKEIAPVLPFLAMAVPGMGGIMGSTMARYLVPQLLTAAGSARTSGKINPLNQLLTLGASYAAGPKSMASTPDQSAFMADKVAPGGTTPIGYSAGQVDPGLAQAAGINTNPALIDSASKFTYTPGMTGTEFARANPNSFKAFTKAPGFKSQNTFLDNVRQTVTQPFGQSIKNVGDAFSGDFSNIGFGDIMKVGGLGATAAGIDQSTLAQLEAEAEAAKNAGDIQGYRDASAAVAAAIARFSDPTNKYGNNPFMANQGGRVGYKDGDLVSKIYGKAKPGYGLSKKLTIPLAGGVGLGGYGLLSLIDAVRAATGMADGGRIGMNMGGGLGSIPQTPTVPQGMQLDGRGGGFIPMGAQERKDDVPAMLAKNEFVMTADAVRAAGGGSVEKGAQKMYDVMNQLESQV